MKTISIENLKQHIIDNQPIIDVRAAIEFKTGHIPGSVNLPILNDQERHDVGTCYKQKGQAAAIALGHSIVCGENLKNKVDSWKAQILKNPKTIVTCFRGGLRSQLTQKFLLDEGIEIVRIEKGYKSARQFFIQQLQDFSETKPMLILSGTTGSAKTQLLNQISNQCEIIDLEGLACHRGSAFGAMSKPQPAQADFENQLAAKTFSIDALNNKPVIIEDESRLIGACHIPEVFFKKMRSSAIVLIQQPLEERVQTIFNDYIQSESDQGHFLDVISRYKLSVQKIQKKLGGLRAAELLHDIEQCEHDFMINKGLLKNKIWIEKILVWYYDAMYLSSLETRNPKIQFKGTADQVKSYLQSLN